MEKDIITFGFEIPGYSNFEKIITSNISLMDADIVLISPEILQPSSNGWVSFSSGGGGCYNVSASTNFINKLHHLKKELSDMLKLGKTIFLLLSEKNTFSIALSTSHPRKGHTTFNTTSSSNYDFLPINIGKLTSAFGEKIHFTGNSIFANFNRDYNKNLAYQVYLENNENCNVIYTGKDSNKVLGSIQKVGNGHLITLPVIEYSNDFKIYNEEEDKYFWTKEGISFGKNLIQNLFEIDKNLTSNINKTPIPEWATSEEFLTAKAK